MHRKWVNRSNTGPTGQSGLSQEAWDFFSLTRERDKRCGVGCLVLLVLMIHLILTCSSKNMHGCIKLGQNLNLGLTKSRYCWTPIDYVDEEHRNGQCLVYKLACDFSFLSWKTSIRTLKTVPSWHVETYLGCMSTTSHIQAIHYSQVYPGRFNAKKRHFVATK